MSKKKQINNRLNDLFADMGEEASPISEESEVLPGWTWQCDAVGYYTACSPEIEDILGFKAASFLGRLMTQHQLSTESSKDLMTAIGEGENESVEITLQFNSKHGKLIPIRSKIFRQDTDSGNIAGWSGFAQMILPDTETYHPYSTEKITPLPPSDSISSPRAVKPQTTSKKLGFAIEENQTLSVSSPYSGAGKQSLKQHQTVAYPSAPGIEAALAVPIPMADETIGLLEITDASPEREWSQDEQLLVEEVAEQLSLAMENARLFEETQISLSRTEALFEVSRVSMAFENTQDLLQTVVDTISAVLPANRTQAVICDIQKEEISNFLESNSAPISIEENTFEELMSGLAGWCLRERKPAISLKGRKDLRESSRAHEKRITSMDGSIIVVPMIYRDQVFGTLSAINRIDQSDFTQNDVDLLSAMSNQVATALANANSFQEEQRRRRIAATLSQIARVIGGSLELEQIAERLLAEIMDVIEFNAAYLQIIEGDNRETIGEIFKDGNKKSKDRKDLVRPISEDPLIRTVVESKQPVSINETSAHPLWEPLPETIHVRSWIAAPLIRGETVIGLLMLEHTIPNAYDEEASDLLSGIAAQAAVALHNARLFQQAQSRSTQLQTAAEVSRAASSILDPNPLIEQTVNLIRDRFDLYYVGVFLIDDKGTYTRESGTWAVLRAGTGDAGRIQIERNHKLEVGGTSMVGQCIDTAQPQISQRVQVEEQRFVNPLLPETRSELALPLISRGLVTGAMTIQSTQPAAFSEEDIAILQTMADQVANALQNASLFDQTQIRAEELAVLNEMSRQLTATVDIDVITRNIYLFASRLIDTSTFFIALYDDKTDLLNFSFATEENQEVTISDQVQSQGLTKYIIENRESLLISENIEDWMRNHQMDFVPVSDKKSQVAQSWLGVPMLAGDDVIGIINVQHKNLHHYSEQEHDLLVAIASQGAIAFQNASLFSETRQRTEDLGILNEMSKELAILLDINKVLSAIYEYTTKLMDTTHFFIALYDSDEKLVSMPFVINNNQRIEMAPRQLGKGLSDFIIRNRQHLLMNVNIADRMKELGVDVIPVGDAEIPRSWLGVPMMIGDRVLGVIAVQSLTTSYLFQERHRDLLASVASQGAITIQNTRLFAQTQQQLADLTNIQQTTTELSAAITMDEVIKTLLENLATAAQANTISLFMLRDNDLERVGLYPIPEDESETGISISLDDYPLTKNAIETRKPMALSADDPRLQEHARETFKTSGISANMTVPLIGPEGPIGILSLNRQSPAPLFNDQEINLIETLATQAAISFQNAQLFEQIQQRSQELQLINRVVSRVASSLELKESLQIVIHEIGRITEADTGGVAIFDETHTTLTLLADYIPNPNIPSAVGLELPLEANPASQEIIKTKEAMVINDVQNNPLMKSIHEPMRERGIETIMLYPLIVGNRVIGTIGLDFKTKNRTLSESEQNLVQTIILQAATAIQNARLFERTQQQLEDLTIIQETTTRLSETLNISDVVNTVLEQTSQSIQADSASLYLLQGEYLTRLGIYPQLEDGQTTINEVIHLESLPITKKVVETRESSNSKTDDPSLQEHARKAFKEAGIAVNANIPMIGPEGVIGILTLNRFEPAQLFDSEEINLVSTLANQAAAALENARLYQELSETADQLREIDTLKSQFLANMSHELRTPLNSIIGFSRVIMKGIDGPVTDLQQQDLSAIYNAGQHLLNMINDILDISKIEAGKMELAFDDVELPSIIDSVLSTARGLVKDKQVKLITEVEDNLPIITADPTRIRQILLNLISNSAKFTDDGSITMIARKQENQKGGHEIYLAVADTGTGIAEEDQHKLFVPFSQVDGSPTRKVEGTGLGLSITRLLIDLHGGEIGVDSELGKGSTFWFTLPLPDTSIQPDKDGKSTIIAIDDDAQVISLYERYLKSAGYQVIAITDPHEALEKVREIKPYAITLDIMMPDFDGWKLLENLKADLEIGHIPVVICSILAEYDKGMKLGAVNYLTKPILEDDLIQSLNKLSEKS